MEGKRNFPFYSDVDSFSVKRQGVEGAEHAGAEYVQPRVFQQPFDNFGEVRKDGTDFSVWTDAQLREFLDQRGGEHNDCRTLEQLIERAVEVEINTGPAKAPAAAEEEEEYDPLDAFMVGIDSEVQKLQAEPPPLPATAGTKGGRQSRADLQCDEAYDAADFMAARQAAVRAGGAAASMAGGGDDSDEDVYAAARAAEAASEGLQYDEHDQPILDSKSKKNVDSLEPLDHDAIEYDDFATDFFEEPPEMFAMDDIEVSVLRMKLDLRVAGFDAPKPIKAFNHCGFDAALMAAVKKAGYMQPTAIQAQALPAILSGRDVLGIAKTGSGKTAAFVLPMLVHIMDQPELAKGEGPIGVIVAPTRELAEQIHRETRKFSRVYNLRVAAAIGGLSKYDQFKDLKAGSEVAVCTPGRLIDLIKQKACTMRRTTYLVMDECDRMFDLGFEPQVRSIVGQIRPDRQTLLFSATMPRKVERLVTDILNNPITITVGMTGAANTDVRQEVAVVADDGGKARWLVTHLSEFIDLGEVLVFANQRVKVDALVVELAKGGARVGGIHGDMDQFSRNSVLDAFRQGTHHVLVATDVAARGLDIKTLKTVINYDAAKDIETHIHRVGRTGRAGDKEGVAYTLLLPHESRFASQLKQSLELAGQDVPPALSELALKDHKSRPGGTRPGGKGSGKGRGPAVGGAGLGFGAKAAEGLPGNNQPGPGGRMHGFARSHDDYEQESSASARVSAPPPPGSQEAPAAAQGASVQSAIAAALGAARAAAAAAMGTLPPPPPVPSGGAEAARAMAAAPPPQAQPAEAARPAEPSTKASFISDGRDFVAQAHANRFKSSFVSSGTTGGATINAATVVAPKQATHRTAPPPPIPVSERPMYLTAGQIPAGGFRSQQSRGGGYQAAGQAWQAPASTRQATNESYHAAPPSSSGYGATVVCPPGQQMPSQADIQMQIMQAKAQAAAMIIAARLAAQAPRES